MNHVRTVPDHELRKLVVGASSRSYHIHFPPDYDGRQLRPLVLAFHGGGVNAETMIYFSGLSEKADEAGFVVAYPEGTGRVPRARTWNAGHCCGHAFHHGVDDVAFVRALLDELDQTAAIDPRRVYATGMSNGAMMSYRLANELADRFAAIAPVAGPMAIDRCQPSRPVSVIHFHGTADEYTPYQGGKGPRSQSQTAFHSVDYTIEAWVAANGCPAEPATMRLPTRAVDGTSVIQRVYGPGREGAEVVLFTIEGGGHTWPGRSSIFQTLGPSTRQIVANDLMWEFFEKHPR
ncbi:MAG TPA: PHB depolymerase family esterase [Pirellulales bacterium]|nr:PHB depolymerase family esterase [Pirellulales bacterium]